MAVGTPSVGTMQEQTTSGTTILVPYPPIINPGDVLVLALATAGSAATAITVPGTNPNVWNQIDQLASTGSTLLPSAGAFWLPAKGTESGTLSVTTSNIVRSGQMLSFPGVDLSHVIDDVADQDQTSTSFNTVLPSIDPTVNGAAVIAIGSQNSVSATSTPPSGFTETADRVSASARSWHMSYELGVAAGPTGTATIVWNGNNRSVGIIFALRSMAGPRLTTNDAEALGSGIRRGRRRH